MDSLQANVENRSLPARKDSDVVAARRSGRDMLAGNVSPRESTPDPLVFPLSDFQKLTSYEKSK